MSGSGWGQVVIEHADWQAAELVAVRHLRPAFSHGTLARWFYIRKRPCWRLRYQPADSGISAHLTRLLDDLTGQEVIAGWTAGIYEPEVLSFGGDAAMEVAHDLFHDDSVQVLDHLAADRHDLGRRELGTLLCSVLLRSAGLDWFEQGDVWARILQHRPAARSMPADQRRHLPAVARLMTADVGPASALVDGGPLTWLAGWSAAFERAGQRLAGLERRGLLERGLRAVLAHHVLFHWNRLGLSYSEQSILSTLAKEVVMTDADDAVLTREPAGDERARAAERLRNALVDGLRDEGLVRSERVESALRAVPRHAFVPSVSLETAYADDIIRTKYDGAGMSISAASQPRIVAMMLEQLQVEPGHRVLEIGAGTGYNAALLAHLAGEAGQITTIDVDDDIVEAARSGLRTAGVQNVCVILGDGALGWRPGAPYDRIIATVGAHDVPPAWLDQLAPGGRLVVPLRLRGGVSRSLVLERGDGHWHCRSSTMCSFMPLRGLNGDVRRIVPLTADGAVRLEAHSESDADARALTGVLDHPRHTVWTGVWFGPAECFEWLDLWLTCAVDGGLSRMPVQRPAVEKGIVDPQFGWGAMAVTAADSLAYLTLRPAESVAGAERAYEVGVIGHGGGGEVLASRVAREIQTWDREYRSRVVRIELQPGDAPDRIEGQFTFDGAHNRLAISWD